MAIVRAPEHGEGVGRLVSVDATKTGLFWDFKEIHRSISTVSNAPDTGLLFIADFSGFVFCLDAETGKNYWEYDMKAHMWGSTFVAGGKCYVGDEDGDIVVPAATKEGPKMPGELNMGAPIHSTAVVANGILYIGTRTHLFAIGKDARPETTAAAKQAAAAQLLIFPMLGIPPRSLDVRPAASRAGARGATIEKLGSAAKSPLRDPDLALPPDREAELLPLKLPAQSRTLGTRQKSAAVTRRRQALPRIRPCQLHFLESPSRQAIASSSTRTASMTGTTGRASNEKAGKVEQTL